MIACSWVQPVGISSSDKKRIWSFAGDGPHKNGACKAIRVQASTWPLAKEGFVGFSEGLGGAHNGALMILDMSTVGGTSSNTLLLFTTFSVYTFSLRGKCFHEFPPHNVTNDYIINLGVCLVRRNKVKN